ncbi:DNA-directed RNA polymerase subunit K [Candidatus Woesearchaeota archaeon]|nr:DNA-directed RNA polymerase subunit K [Candidatus Woesearchaeota archaeon]
MNLEEEGQIVHTKYEKARMIGSRALQLSQGAPFLVKLNKKELEEVKYNPIEIATIEFDRGLLPITVKRPLPKKKEKNK